MHNKNMLCILPHIFSALIFFKAFDQIQFVHVESTTAIKKQPKQKTMAESQTWQNR